MHRVAIASHLEIHIVTISKLHGVVSWFAISKLSSAFLFLRYTSNPYRRIMKLSQRND